MQARIDELVEEIQVEWKKVEKEKTIEKEVLKPEVESQLNEGIEYYRNQKYDEAINIFQKILTIDPTNTNIIKNLRKAERQRAFKGGIKVIEKPKKQVSEKQCIWSKAGVISYRVCIINFKCDACEFAQTMQDTQEGYADGGDFSSVRKKLLELPAQKRKCRYMLSDDITFKLCPSLYECSKCEFDQLMQDIKQDKQEKLMHKIEKMTEKKRQKMKS